MAGLSVEQKASFERDGFLFPVPLLERGKAEEARRRFLDARQAAAGDQRIGNCLYYKANLAFRWADEIVHTPALLDAVTDLLGPDLLLWSCSFVYNDPRSSGRYTWHQDATYWGLVPPVGLTVWLALGDVGQHNGAMSFVPGIHKRGQLAHTITFAADVLLPRGQQIDDLPDVEKAVPLQLASGEASFHHVFTPHASGANPSDDVRVGCAMVFLPPSVRHESMRESAMLVRGEDRHGHFDLEPRPKADLDAEAIAAHAAAMAKMGTFQAEQALPKEHRSVFEAAKLGDRPA